MTPLAKKIQEKISEIGISQRKVAIRAGIPESTLRNILRGTALNSTPKTLEKISKVIGVDMLTLVTANTIGKEQTEEDKFRSEDVNYDFYGQATKELIENCEKMDVQLNRYRFQRVLDLAYDCLVSQHIRGKKAQLDKEFIASILNRLCNKDRY